ncbi:MAG: B12-binding domain-containing radical SAM protein [Lachnospiraceae bacterium]
MTKFLLVAVNAKYIHSNPALYSLKAFAAQYESHIEIAEYTINNQTEHILADIYKKKPTMLAFSCYIWNWDMIQELIVELHKLLPEVPIWLGGPEVSYDAVTTMRKLPQLEGIMIGEGENTFLELMGYYVDGKGSLPKISGIITRAGINAPRELTNMDDLPFLYHDLDEFDHKIIYYESSRGCPFRCSYCLSSIDKTVRLRDIEIVKQELQFFLDSMVSQVKFVDRTFNCNHAHAMAIWRYLKEHDNGVTNFHFEISADIMNEEEIALLHSLRPGFVQLEIGVQSTNAVTLKEIHRYVQFEALKKVVEQIKSGENIHIHLDLIAGLPYEDYDSFANSFNEVYAMRPQQLQLGFLKILKGSQMQEQAEKYGIQYTDRPPYEVLYSKWLSYEDVIRLKAVEEMLELYYNSNQFTTTLPALEQLFQSPFAFYEALADFYEQKGYFNQSPSRVYRYEVLQQFALEIDSKHGDVYRELLTHDCYLRENLKSRPSFSMENTVGKEQLRDFYEREEKNRTYLAGYEEYDAKQMSKMTHMEAIAYPLWASGTQRVYNRLSKEQYLLFDYRNRDALTHQATITYIEDEQG